MAVADPEGAFSTASAHARRYDLDWLRVIAFGLLIFYHIGMFYVSWGWHVKSVYAGPAPEPLMLLVNPWRLGLLFFISGVAVRFASDKAGSAGAFVRARALRLGLPVLAGIVVTVAPQTYFELRQAGLIEPGFGAFYRDYLRLEQVFPMTTPTWNHLWYVVYLLCYILIIAPVLPSLRRLAEGAGARGLDWIAGGPLRLLFLVIIPFVVFEAILSPRFPTTHALWGDWANHAHRFTIFMLGYFAAKHAPFWRSVTRAAPMAAALAVGIGALRLAAQAGEGAFAHALFDGPAGAPLSVLYAWSCIVVLFALAQDFLNRPSKALSYLTGAVFCYYILHQTITVVAGYCLTQMALGPWLEFAMLSALTIGGCAAGYEIVRRIPGLRIAFGVKAPPRRRPAMALA